MRRCLLSLTTAVVLAVCPAGHSHADNTCCPACNYACEVSTEVVQEKQTCFDVEEKAICIPPITLPWERSKGKGGDSAVGTRCGKVKIVRVLVKQEYECARCKYTWTAVPLSGEKSAVKEQADASVVTPGHDIPPPPTVDPSAQRPSRIKSFIQFAKERSNVTRLFTSVIE